MSLICRLNENSLRLLHRVVLEKDPNTSRGYIYESMVKGSTDRPFTEVFSYDFYPGIFNKAAALAHSIIVFHPFTDGNKRTAILAICFFLYFHGYEFMISRDTIDFILKISKGEIDDIQVIAKFIKSKSRRRDSFGRFIYWLNRISLYYFHNKEIDFYDPPLLTGLIISLSTRILEFTRKFWP